MAMRSSLAHGPGSAGPGAARGAYATRRVLSPPPPLPVPSLGAAAPRPPHRPEGPRPQTPDGLKLPGPAKSSPSGV
ncbi:hypothetical protein EJ357_25290 [Streptomyces cyaneochromogenes]|uniref:Uncharacterized protein n=1 Tax=Streptomyces cyaneochromogenes TaxID=2496836 RepID=A0A3Q9EPC7_9ACTN|nr:hypothetical protein EJ357_25290 [Streptomyces cyaneochromogenes]